MGVAGVAWGCWGQLGVAQGSWSIWGQLGVGEGIARCSCRQLQSQLTSFQLAEAVLSLAQLSPSLLNSIHDYGINENLMKDFLIQNFWLMNHDNYFSNPPNIKDIIGDTHFFNTFYPFQQNTMYEIQHEEICSIYFP